MIKKNSDASGQTIESNDKTDCPTKSENVSASVEIDKYEIDGCGYNLITLGIMMVLQKLNIDVDITIRKNSRGNVVIVGER